VLAANTTVAECEAFVHRWFQLLAAGRFEQAIELLNHDGNSEQRWTTEKLRRLIEVDTFGAETKYAEKHPLGVKYSDPDHLPPRRAGDGKAVSLSDGTGWSIWATMPLNDEWSDLTACFEFQRKPDHMRVSLCDIHVL